MFDQIAETFCSMAALRFVILLWGEKSLMACKGVEGLPFFTYNEIIDLGRDNRRSLFDSHAASKSIN